MSSEETFDQTHPVPPGQVNKAIKISYIQAMLVAVFGASTGGGLVTAYFLKLGATDEQIGLLSTVPMYAVFAQLIAAVLIERGACRKRMTVVGSMAAVLCWGLVIALPVALRNQPVEGRISALIAVFTLISVFNHIAGNARASWIGDLIPSDRLGTFFGRLVVYGGVIGAVLAILSGRFLDLMKHAGVSAFGWVFAFGMVFGIVNSVLYTRQADVPTSRHSISLAGLVRQTFGNKSLMAFMGFAIFWNMQTIGWPFYAPYLLRDIKLTYFQFSMIGTIQGITVLASAPFWGRMVSRHGCRPVLILSAAITLPVAAMWAWISTPLAAFITVPIVNIITGFANGGIGVAVSTIIYKVTAPTGRAVQMAIYAAAVVLLVAPMPTIGGHLPGWLNAHGIHADIRVTFYASQLFCLAALLMAKRVVEPGSTSTGEMIVELKDKVVGR